jgi:Domain of unknown function (DUF4265)
MHVMGLADRARAPGGVGNMPRQSTLDRSKPDQATTQLFVDWTSEGQPLFEEVPVEALGDERYRVLASPGLLDGLAAGDVFERRPDGTFAVLERSGNLCVQIWYPDADLRARVDAELMAGVTALGGWLDGRTAGASVLTFPLSAGFARIEDLLDAWVATAPEARWSYANVYAEDGWTPLRWWEADEFRDQLAAAASSASRSDS